MAFHKHKAEWWRECWDGLGCEWPSGDYVEGACVYVSEYVAMHEGFLANCKQIWAEECEKPLEKPAATTLNVPTDGQDNYDSDTKELVEDVEMDNFV